MKRKESYFTTSYYGELKQRRGYLSEILKRVDGTSCHEVSGRLHIVKNKDNRVQYYQRINPADKNGKYIKKKDIQLAYDLAQGTYDENVIKNASGEIIILDELLEYLSHSDVTRIYESMCEERKKLVTPIEKTDDVFVAEWKNQRYESMAFANDFAVFTTKNNERVRSKSEILIANTLYDYGIPYKYECPIYDEFGQIWSHPDFSALNVRERKEFKWEHFGMMDDTSYAEKAVRKITKYTSQGYYQGKNILYTFETSQTPLSTLGIERVIKEYLL